MISLTRGNILNTPFQTITNPVNCIGVMGKGLAKQIADSYPEILPKYKAVCNSGFLRPGRLHLVKCRDKWILNFPTKIHWREKSKLEYIEAGLVHLRDHGWSVGITSIAIPRIGCGLGGLPFSDIKPLIIDTLKEVPFDVELYC